MLTEQNFYFNPPSTLPASALTSLNALNHGGAAETLFLPEEDPTVFFSNLHDAFAQYEPGNAQDSDLVTQSVHARWFLSRRMRVHASYEYKVHTLGDNPVDWTNDQLNRINLFDRYKTQAERALRRALTNVQSISKDAIREKHWQELYELKKQSFAFQVRKWEAAQEKAKPRAQKMQEELDELISKLPPKKPPVQMHEDFNCSVIVQSVFIHEERGATFIGELNPSNDKVQQLINQKDSYAQPPQGVVRNYHFMNGIPLEYEFLIDAENPRPEEDEHDTCVFMEFAEWEAQAEKEYSMLASQPKSIYARDDDDDDES